MSEEEFITLFYKQLLDKGNKSQINGGRNKGVTDVFIVEGEAILSVKLRLTNTTNNWCRLIRSKVLDLTA